MIGSKVAEIETQRENERAPREPGKEMSQQDGGGQPATRPESK